MLVLIILIKIELNLFFRAVDRMTKFNSIIDFLTQRMWLKYSLMIVFFSFLFLFARKPTTATGTYCGEYVKVSHMGFVLFCDSYQYIYLTSKPSLLLDADFVAVRQNRPLYIYAAHIIGLPIKLVLYKFISSSYFDAMDGQKHLFQKSINEKLASSPFLKIYHIEDHKNLVVELLPYYLAFILMNFIILLLSLCLFEKLLLQLKVQQYIIHFLSLFIVCSGLVKAFFFSAHEQMFAFFTPIFIAHIIYLFLNDKIQCRKLLLISFLMGILCLAYGSFILYFPCFIIASFIKQNSICLSKLLIFRLFANAVVFVIPTCSWVFICIHYSGHYFNGEVVTFREFVWIKDAISVGFFHFLYVCLDFTSQFFKTVLFTLIPFFVGIYILSRKTKNIDELLPQKSFFYFTQWMFFLFFCFFWILGYYNFRLTYTCVPILLIGIAMKTQFLVDNKIIDNSFLYKRLRLLSVIWLIWSIIKYGPFPFQ